MPGKYNTILLFCFMITGHLSGQVQKPKNESWYDEKPVHFGFTLGFNAMDFKIVPVVANDSLLPDVSQLNPGINIQIVTDLRLGRYFDLRFLPGVSFGQRVIKYSEVRYNSNSNNTFSYIGNHPVPQELESSFLEFPLLLKYKGARLNNVRPYVIGGFNYRYDLAGKKEYDDERPVYIRLRRPDLYYEMGAGMDFYLPFFKLSIELKLSSGINNVLANEPHPRYPEYFHSIENMKSRIWILSFHFE